MKDEIQTQDNSAVDVFNSTSRDVNVGQLGVRGSLPSLEEVADGEVRAVDADSSATFDQPRPVAYEQLLVKHETERTSELVGGERSDAVSDVVQTGEEPAAVLRVGVVTFHVGTDESFSRHRRDFTGTWNTRTQI